MSGQVFLIEGDGLLLAVLGDLSTVSDMLGVDLVEIPTAPPFWVDRGHQYAVTRYTVEPLPMPTLRLVGA